MEIDVPEERAQQLEDYYLQDAVVEEMVRVAEGREVGPTFPYGYGSRPDAVNFPGDFERLVEDGAVAFHGSVERWKNPMLIGEVDSDDLRTGWDLVIDIDCDEDDESLSLAKATALAIIEEFENLGIEHYSIKFSGNRGFHLGLRTEAFPESVQNKTMADWYPELPRTIVDYLRYRINEGNKLARKLADIRPDLGSEIMSTDATMDWENLGAEVDSNPFQISDVENNWGDRHLFRMPYSVNEKSWLVSLPLEPSEEAIMAFEKPDAAIEEVTVEYGFLDSYEEGEAMKLVVEALDWRAKQPGNEERETFEGDFEVPEDAVAEEHFPPTIHNILQGLEDGRKRAVFILITFLQHLGYGFDAIEAMLWEWNERNDAPLDTTYIRSQLNWHERQDEPLMPPNWDSNGFYKDMNVYEEDPLTEATSNPVPYALAKASDEEEEQEAEESSKSTWDDKPTMECPYCGKEYKGETKWYRDHVVACDG